MYYDMKLVTFGINKERNLIVQFPVFVQLYTQQQMILYHSYTHLQVDRPYIAPHSEIYIPLRHQELRTSKNIGYEFYYKELFVVKHKTKHCCKSVIYFYLGFEIIKENCNFAYYFNKTDVKPAVLDGGNEIILANLPNNKHIKCNIKNGIPVKIPRFLYVLVKRSVLCKCEIEPENHLR